MARGPHINGSERKMTLFSSNIKFRDLFKRAQVIKEAAQTGRDASSDWRVLCVSFLLLILCAIAISVVVYGMVDKGNIFLTEKEKPVALRSFDRFKLERTVLFFEEKKEQFNALKQKPLSTVDPYMPREKPQSN